MREALFEQQEQILTTAAPFWVTESLQSPDPNPNRPLYVSFVSKAILWERGVRASVHNDHTVAHHDCQLCPRFMSHMKVCPENLKPLLRSKSKPQPLFLEEPCAHPTARKTQKPDDLKVSVRHRDLHQDPVARKSVVCPSQRSTPPLPKIKPKLRCTSSPVWAKPQEDEVSTTLSVPQTSPAGVENIVFKKADIPLPNTSNTNLLMRLCPTEQVLPESSHHLCQSSLSDRSHPSSLFSRSLDLSGRSSILSDKSLAEYDYEQIKSPEDIIGSSQVHSSHVQQSPMTPHHAPLPLYSPTNLSTSLLISKKFKGQANVPTSPLTSPVPLCETHEDKTHVQERPNQEAQAELQVNITPHSVTSSGHSEPMVPSANTSPLVLSPLSSVCGLGSLWPVLPPISKVQEWCNTAACYSSEVSCSQSQVFDELDAIVPLSASLSSVDDFSNSSYSASKDTDVSPGLAALTVNCDSGNLGSLSRVKLLLLNRQEPDTASTFSLDEDLPYMDNYPDMEMNNGVWRPFTAGSVSEKCASIGKAHQNKPDDLEECSGSPCSWIIDPSPLHILKSSVSQSNSSQGSSGDEGDPSDRTSNCSSNEDAFLTFRTIEDGQFRQREERKTKMLKILSKLQDSPHQPKSCKSHSNFEDFDFLSKYCIFNQEKLVEYKRAFEEEDSDGDGYISCLQVMFALKSIIPPELLAEEEEIYVYRILEMVDFRVTDGLVDLRLFAVIASLAQKIATMDEFMRSLISNIDFRSLEVKLFKAKKLFLFLLEEQASDGMSQQKYISPEQLILELKAGGICLEQEAAIRVELQHIPPLDLLDFLAYLPLFMLIHKSVIANPLDDLCH